MREAILQQNLQTVQADVVNACKRSNRNPAEVTVMAVTKYAADKDVLFLLEKGLLSDVGESRVQQAWKRWKENPAFARYAVTKHFIGHLQKNKAAKAAQLFDFIDSLDSFETAQLLSEHTPAGKVLRVLVQVKLTQRETQTGLPLPQARALVAQLQKARLTNLHVCGYMGIAPQGADTETLRTLFRTVKNAFEADFPTEKERYLSLGMSHDFITAVEEGSTLIRIGSGLFADHLEEV
jgi:hypothetical protein